MSLTKRQRNDGLEVVEAYWITEPSDLDSHPFSALLDAVAADDFAEASRLLRADEAVDLLQSPAGLPSMTPPLIQAIWRGNNQIADLLLQRSSKRALTDVFDVAFGGNPVHWAAAAGRDLMLERLLSQPGPSCVNTRSYEGFTPLHAAAGHGHTACVRILLHHKADPDIVDLKDSAPLHEAAEWGHTDAARELVVSKANPERRNCTHETPLLLAARGGHADIVKLLLDAGAAIETTNAAGITPLLSAAFFGHEPTVKLLCARGANVEAVDAGRRRSSLEWAAFNDHKQVVEALVGQQRSFVQRLEALATEGGAEEVSAFLKTL